MNLKKAIWLIVTMLLPYLTIILLHIPIIGIPVIIASLPLFEIIPEFSKTGEHVGWSFFGPFLKDNYALFIFYIYYSTIIFPISGLLYFLTNRKKKQ